MDNAKLAKAFIIGNISGIVLASVLWFVFGRGNIPDNSNGAATVRDELSNAETTATNITNGVENAQQRADRARESTNRIESIVAETGDAITDCQQIVAGVRARGKVKKTAD